MRRRTMSRLALIIIGLAASSVCVAGSFPAGVGSLPSPAGAAAAQHASAVPALVEVAMSPAGPEGRIAAARPGANAKQKKPKKSAPRFVPAPEIDAKAGSQAIALLIGVLLLGFERLRRSA